MSECACPRCGGALLRCGDTCLCEYLAGAAKGRCGCEACEPRSRPLSRPLSRALSAAEARRVTERRFADPSRMPAPRTWQAAMAELRRRYVPGG